MFKPNELPADTKRLVVLVVAAAAVAASATAGVVLHGQQSLDVDAEIVGHSDPDEIHRVSQLRVRVTNTGQDMIEPSFNTVHSQLQTRFYWRIAAGPDHLVPGQTATYTLRPPVATAAAPYNASVLLTINDRGGDHSTKVGPVRFNKTTPSPLLNPDLRYWQTDPGELSFHAYRWSDAESNQGDESTDLSYDTNSVRLTVSNVSRESGPWAMRGVIQHGSFPETVHIEATPQTVMPKPIEHPWRPTGVEIGHGNKRVWIIFANVSTHQVVYRGGELQYLMVYVPATAGERTEVAVNVEKLYDWYGWERPEPAVRTIDGQKYHSRPAHVLAFAAVYPNHPQGSASVEFHEIRAVEQNHTTEGLLSYS